MAAAVEHGGTVVERRRSRVKLACDEMLQGLGRWLRAAGYDTFVARGGMDDRALLQLCREQGRALITRDRGLGGAKAVEVLVLGGDTLESQAREVAAGLGLDWRLAPFTRCVEDNTPLRPASAPEVARMPAAARTLPGPLRTCPECGRLYWPGSHVRRMQAKLEAFAAEAGQASRT